MKILVTSLPDLNRTLVQRPHHLLAHLSLNHEITVVCIKAWQLKPNRDEYLDRVLRNVKVLYPGNRKLPSLGQELLAILGKEPTFSTNFLRQFDLHINLNSLISGYVRTRKMKVLGIPSIFDICDDLVEWVQLSPQIPGIFKLPGIATAKVLLNRIVKSSGRVTYTSSALLKPQWEDASKFTLVPNGVNTEFFLPSSCDDLRNELGFKPGDNVIGFVGALEEWVDLEPVFAAVSEIGNQFSNYKLLIVGSGSKFGVVKGLAQKYRCENAVVFTGQMPYEEIPKYVACMDICVLPFASGNVAQKALPLKLFEYMSCEKPVISTPLTGVKEAVADAVHYALNSVEFKQSILTLSADPNLRTKMGREGRQLVKRRFSWPTICREFELIAEELVNNAKGK